MNCKTIKTAYLFVALCIFYCVLARLFFNLPMNILFFYLLAQVFIIFTPGYALLCLFRWKNNIVERLTLAYTLGYAVNILEYLLFYGCNMQRFAAALVWLIAFLSFFGIAWLGRPEDNGKREKDCFVLLGIFLIYLLINCISYGGNAVSPLMGQGMLTIPRDVQFWCSNAAALKLAFPPEPLYLDGGILYYHYFSSMQIALVSQVSGIDIFSLAFPLYSFGKCLLVIGGANALLNCFQTGKSKMFFMLLLLFMTGVEKRSIVTFVRHMIEGPFGFDIGFAFALWFLTILIRQWQTERFSWSFFWQAMLMWLVAVGAKAPIAAVLIFVPALFCLVWLIKQDYKKAFLYGGGIVAIFLLVSIVFAGVLRITAHSYEGMDASMLTLYSLDEVLKIRHFGRAVNLILSILYHIFYSHPAMTIFTVLNSCVCAAMVVKKKLSVTTLLLAGCLLLTTVIGLGMGIFIRAGGHSEMYFTMAAFISCTAYNAELWTLSRERNKSESRKRKNIWQLTMLCLALVGIYNVAFYSYPNGFVENLREGKDKICGQWNAAGVETFDQEEALACIWLRENTDMHSVVLNDRNTMAGYVHDYYVGIFSERQQYLEASDLIYVVDLDEERSVADEVSRRMELSRRLYGNDITALEQVKVEGVHYLLQNDRYTPQFEADRGLLELVYRVGSVSVYRLL